MRTFRLRALILGLVALPMIAISVTRADAGQFFNKTPYWLNVRVPGGQRILMPEAYNSEKIFNKKEANDYAYQVDMWMPQSERWSFVMGFTDTDNDMEDGEIYIKFIEGRFEFTMIRNGKQLWGVRADRKGTALPDRKHWASDDGWIEARRIGPGPMWDVTFRHPQLTVREKWTQTSVDNGLTVLSLTGAGKPLLLVYASEVEYHQHATHVIYKGSWK